MKIEDIQPGQWQEHMRRVVREASVEAFDQHAKVHVGGGKYGKVVSPWFTEVIDAIADRVASQLASAVPVPNEQELRQLIDLRKEGLADDYPAAVLYIDRLLGASR